VVNVSNQPSRPTPGSADIAEPFVRIDVPTAQRLIADGAVQVIDVREPNEYAEGHIPGVTLVPLNTLLSRPQDYLKRDNLLFVCAMGQRSALACEMAAALGMEQVYNLEGGTTAWARAGLPIDK
jgi:rhodanese-related sulfurtransferase